MARAQEVKIPGVKVIVQKIGRKLFLSEDGQWTEGRARANEFLSAVEAIAFCIRCETREVCLVGKNEAGADVWFYPFGGDPILRAELKRLRRGLREGRRLRLQRQQIRARIDAVLAGAKETKKQTPFKRKSVGEPQA